MELNRNQFFFMGMVVLLLGIQFRSVTRFVLTEEATRFLAEQTDSGDPSMMALASDVGSPAKKVVQPPEWLGWCLLSVGAVLILHSLAMRKPG
jgi:hypothetical protein